VGASLTAEVDLLRHALAGIWTELGKDAPDLEGVRRLAGQALRMTAAGRGKDLTLCEAGIEGWEEYLVGRIDRRTRRGEGG
jgi:hypothetical protein